MTRQLMLMRIKDKSHDLNSRKCLFRAINIIIQIFDRTAIGNVFGCLSDVVIDVTSAHLRRLDVFLVIDLSRYLVL